MALFRPFAQEARRMRLDNPRSLGGRTMNRALRQLSPLALAVFVASCAHMTSIAVPRPAGAPASLPRASVRVEADCGAASGRYARCFSLIRTDAFAKAFPNQAGYDPSDLQSAYKLPSATEGFGQTVSVVDAYDDQTAESDLQMYRSKFGLSECTIANGCFGKVNQRGHPQPLPQPNSGWAAEISLDLDMVSAICQNCHVLLVEADDSSAANLSTSVDTAARLGANVISTSFGMDESQSKIYEKHFRHPGHMITASIGDIGFGLSFPGTSPDVTAVGGTTLNRANNRRGWKETIWSGANPECSAVYAKPIWQHDTGCSNRASGDVGAVADPNTGVVVVFHGQFVVFGGTSVSSPIVAGVYALAGNSSALHFAEHSYQRLQDLFNVHGAPDDSCGAACRESRGYNGSTGNGTPNGVGAF
jgi:Subtilase family